ncbi:MAG: cohesin domain-containing protein [Patescibacteria group bacterium]
MRLILRVFLLELLIFGVTITSVFSASPSLLFSPADKTVMQNEQFNIDILVDTAGIDVAGAGAIIKFDNSQLAIVQIDPGIIFADYPALTIDNENGRATISAISGSINDLFNGQGVVATIKFQAKTIGQAKVDFIFEPGSTTDSNIAVTFGNGDVLAAVNELKLNIIQANDGSQDDQQTTVVDNQPIKAEIKGIKGWINNIFRSLNLPEPFIVDDGIDESRIMAASLDPNQSITRQAPITDPNQSQQESVNTYYASVASKPTIIDWLKMPEVYLSLLFVIVTILGYIYWKRYRSGKTELQA